MARAGEGSGSISARAEIPTEGPSTAVFDWSDEELHDLISDAIGDSMDMDWTYRDGAKAVLAALQKEGLLRTDGVFTPLALEDPDALTERLTKVAYATEFLDVREDILALIERDRTCWLDNIAMCELIAKARAALADHPSGAPDRPRR